MGMKTMALMGIAIACAAWNKRRIWSVVKTRKITYRPVSKPFRVYHDPTKHSGGH